MIALLAGGRLDVRSVIGGIRPLAEWREAFAAMHGGEVVKSVLSSL